ncbi:MAG: glucose 1-dehydrogenase [Candidatus Binatia bacterium]
MKAIAVFPSTRDVKLIETPEPRLGSPTHVKLRMLDVGVCGTDREICRFDYGTPPDGNDHLVIGHESLGEVVEMGPEVRTLRAGDLVIPMVRRPCPHATCTACRAGRQDFCFTGDFTERGIKSRHGFMTELVVDDARYMNPVPRTLRDVAVLVEPLTIAEKGLMQMWQVQQRLPWGCSTDAAKQSGYRHQAVVLGAGPVGLLGAMALVAQGFETFVYSREKAPNPKASLVESIGARYVSAEETSLEGLAKRIDGIDVVYEATGASKVAFDMLQIVGPNAVFIFTGVPGRKAPVSVDTDLLMRNMVLKNQVVFGTVNAGKDAFEAAIRDLTLFQERWPKALGALITGRFPIEGHRELLLGDVAGIKNVLRIAA